MNWLEFVAACEDEMRKANVEPKNVVMYIECQDSYYDGPIKDSNQIRTVWYNDLPTDKMYLAIYTPSYSNDT